MDVQRPAAATVVWLILVCLTLITFAVAHFGYAGTSSAALVLGFAAFKGQLVADWFMELRRVRGPWRTLLTGWVVVTAAGIAAAFWLGV